LYIQLYDCSSSIFYVFVTRELRNPKKKLTLLFSPRLMELADILDPLLKHGALDGLTIGNIACVSKQYSARINWDEIKRTYSPNTLRKNILYDGSWRIDEKTALKKYRLISDDVKCVANGNTYLSESEVIGIALLKYGGPARLRFAMLPKRQQTKAYQSRLAVVNKLFDPKAKLFLGVHGIDEYLKNGKSGAMSMKHLAQQYATFVSKLPNKRISDGVLHRVFMIFTKNPIKSFEVRLKKEIAIDEGPDRLKRVLISLGESIHLYDDQDRSLQSRALNGEFEDDESCREAVVLVLEAKRKKLEEKNTRRRELIKALGKFKIKLRSDSVICARYIEHGIGTLESVVSTMSEMAFLYEYTNYHDIMGNAMRNAWYNCRYNSDSDGSDCSYGYNQPDRAAISESCKRRVVRAWVSKPSNDVSKIPDSLRRFL